MQKAHVMQALQSTLENLQVRVMLISLWSLHAASAMMATKTALLAEATAFKAWTQAACKNQQRPAGSRNDKQLCRRVCRGRA